MRTSLLSVSGASASGCTKHHVHADVNGRASAHETLQAQVEARIQVQY